MPMHPGGGHAPKPKAPTNFQEHAYSPKCLEVCSWKFAAGKQCLSNSKSTPSTAKVRYGGCATHPHLLLFAL
jgi:hypothetical protein